MALNTCGFDLLVVVVSMCVCLAVHNRLQLFYSFYDASCDSATVPIQATIGADVHGHDDTTVLVNRTESSNETVETALSFKIRFPLALVTSYHGSVVTGSCVGVLFLTRHLMLWAVFAPKVIFDAGFWVVNSSFIGVLVGCFLLRQ